ncbi:EamA family transporter [Flavobacterium sp. ZS1P70]|uniref:EamA family transporter n=1 Tax=Flavobacterium zhoui TaxID=3230414 RepID=A0ABW6I6H4_9FLAO
MSQFGILPAGIKHKLLFLIDALFDPFIFSGFVAAFAASLCWMAAITHFEITKAYPVMSLAPALVFIIGILFLGETFATGKEVGLLLILLGIIVNVKC